MLLCSRNMGLSTLNRPPTAGMTGASLLSRLARFGDASGAYGAFTYYKMPQMLKETIPDQGASLNERVLFYRGNILVDAVFDKLTAMSAAELRDCHKPCLCRRGMLETFPHCLPICQSKVM